MLVLGLLAAYLNGRGAALVAKAKGRDPKEGFWLGFLGGFPGIIWNALTPPKWENSNKRDSRQAESPVCPECGNRIEEGYLRCRWCGTELQWE